MNRLGFIIFLLIGTNTFAQATPKTAKSPDEFVPSGFVVSEKIQGDLNKDNQADYILIIKGTDKDKIVKDENGEQLDRNRRGIIIAFKNQNQYELALENRDCFSSEDEDGGVYFAPELSVTIDKGKLFVNYSHGRYGYSSYNFRYQNSNFELIGYDSSENSGPVVERSVSVNLMTKKMLIKENINPDAEEDGDEKFKETWKKFTFTKSIRLSEIADFDELDVESLLGQPK